MADVDGSNSEDALEGRSILVLYGTETGNSHEIAEHLGRKCQRMHFHVLMEEMDDIKLNDLLHNHVLVVFVLSTTGQGQFPSNALRLWKSLRRAKLQPGCLSNLNFTTFGLGDSSYAKFNWAARQLHSRLEKLGAIETFPRGEADERHDDGIDSIYRPWLQDFTSYLLAGFPLPNSVQPIPDDEPLPPRYILQIASTMDAAAQAGVPSEGISATGEEQDRLFLANKEKSAALSHITRPMTATQQFDADWDRMADMSNVPYTARLDESTSRIALGNAPASSLDKANVLKDHPSQYLLHPPSPSTHQTLPMPTRLFIPQARTVRVESNTRVTPLHHWQDVRRLKLSLSLGEGEPELLAPPGSTVTIYPKNFMEDVDWLINRMGWNSVADVPVVFNLFKAARPGRAISLGTRPRGLFPMHEATLRKILAHNMDFTAIPTRMFIEKISQYAGDARQKERLIELTQPANSQEFYDFTSRPRRTILELLQEFDSVMMPFDVVPDIFPVIRGREFSIANGGYLFNGEVAKTRVIELLVALVEYKTVIRKPRQGLCSRYIKHVPASHLIQIVIKTTDALIMNELAVVRPLIAIATGTGIAPIRSLIYERECDRKRGDTLLFFGCRNKGADFYYSDDWKKLDQVTVIPAFSRDAVVEETSPGSDVAAARDDAVLAAPSAVASGNLSFDYDQGKNYVQHLIRKHAKEVCRLYAAGAFICICGNSGRMPTSVRQALIDAAVLGGFCSNIEQATALFDESKPRHIHIWQETW